MEQSLAWLIQLFIMQEFWISLTTALIGGFVAYLIARLQVKKSEKNLEQQRKEDNDRHIIELEEAQTRVLLQISETKKHEREMELVRIQLGECKKSMQSLLAITNSAADFGALLENLEKVRFELNSELEQLEIQKKMSNLTINLSGEIVGILSAAKICNLSDEEVKKCEDLRNYTYELFDFGLSIDLCGFLSESLILPSKIQPLYSAFGKKLEELVAQLKAELS